jgi:purine-binding chemotaxis protein CheW
LLVFRLGPQAYALPLAEVREVIPLAALYAPPLMPALLAGFLNLGGTAVPVVRLDRLFDLPEPPPPGRYTPLLLLRAHEGSLALLVERIDSIVKLADADVLPVAPEQAFNDCVTGVATVDAHVVLILSSERLLLEKEQQYLAEVQDREQARLRAVEVNGT